jgi:hypothetical protein
MTTSRNVSFLRHCPPQLANEPPHLPIPAVPTIARLAHNHPPFPRSPTSPPRAFRASPPIQRARHIYVGHTLHMPPAEIDAFTHEQLTDDEKRKVQAEHRTHPSGTYGKGMLRKMPGAYPRATALITEFCVRMVNWGCANYSPGSTE